MKTELSLADAWEQEAEKWVEWARKPGFDSYWQFHRDQFLEIVPPPGELTVDVGCGEGRLTRHLKEMGHKIKGFDASKTLIAAASSLDPEGFYGVANAAKLPVQNDSADLVVSFMVLHDVDDLAACVGEMARILKPRGQCCVAIVHPLNSAGNFTTPTPESEFIVKGTYLGEFKYSDTLERDGMEMTFHSAHRPLEQFSREFERAGLCMEAIREHAVPERQCEITPASRRWQRIPLFMHFKLRKLQGPSHNQ